jgi:aminopeptidase N
MMKLDLFDCTFDANYQVVSNGVLKEKNVNAELANWKYNMNKPMSS